MKIIFTERKGRVWMEVKHLEHSFITHFDCNQELDLRECIKTLEDLESIAIKYLGAENVHL